MGESGDEEVRSGGRKVVDKNLHKLSKLKKHQQFNDIRYSIYRIFDIRVLLVSMSRAAEGRGRRRSACCGCSWWWARR